MDASREDRVHMGCHYTLREKWGVGAVGLGAPPHNITLRRRKLENTGPMS